MRCYWYQPINLLTLPVADVSLSVFAALLCFRSVCKFHDFPAAVVITVILSNHITLAFIIHVLGLRFLSLFLLLFLPSFLPPLRCSFL